MATNGASLRRRGRTRGDTKANDENCATIAQPVVKEKGDGKIDAGCDRSHRRESRQRKANQEEQRSDAEQSQHAQLRHHCKGGVVHEKLRLSESVRYRLWLCAELTEPDPEREAPSKEIGGTKPQGFADAYGSRRRAVVSASQAEYIEGVDDRSKGHASGCQ